MQSSSSRDELVISRKNFIFLFKNFKLCLATSLSESRFIQFFWSQISRKNGSIFQNSGFWKIGPGRLIRLKRTGHRKPIRIGYKKKIFNPQAPSAQFTAITIVYYPFIRKPKNPFDWNLMSYKLLIKYIHLSAIKIRIKIFDWIWTDIYLKRAKLAG